MKQYRKKPVVIEAIELNRNFAEVAVDWIGRGNVADFNIGEFAEDACFIEIKTLEGTMLASEGDFIIRGIKGEYYPCKPDIFAATYEAV